MKIKDAVRLALLYCHQNGWLPSGVWGQDTEGVGPKAKGGVLAETMGLPFAHNTILNERSAAWLPYGAAFLQKPAVGIMQFPDYQHNTYDILKLLGETCWSTGGRVPMPVVIMAAYGALGGKGALYHSQTPENEIIGLPGWKVVSAATPNDAAILLVAAIRDPNPVYFMYPRAHSGFPTDSATTQGLAHLELPGFEFLPGEKELLEAPTTLKNNKNARNQWYAWTTPPPDQKDGSWIQEWPEGLEIPQEPLGKVRICREGDFAAILSHGRMLPMCWKAAEAIGFLSGQEVAVIDLRTLKPLPLQDLKPYVQTTRGRLLLVNEATAQNNWMKTMSHEITAQFGWDFDTYPVVLCAKDFPVGQALVLEQAVLPQIWDVVASLFQFLTPEAVVKIGERVGKPMKINADRWFEYGELKELGRIIIEYTEKNDPVFKTPVNPLRSLARSQI